MRHIGRYEVLAELGHGGFGRVYRGLDPTVGRQVAIKTLIADGDAGMLSRFRNEAAASGRLRHPNIVTIYDFGEQDGAPYIVMELLEGQDLQHAMEGGTALSTLNKVQIMTQIGAGLRHAHAHGIIHRDVKPANVMLLNDGSVKLMDFGIALVTQGTQLRVTPRGAMIGTFRYMAPEQFRGAEPDARSDIFSYGLIFYELLSGVHPFHASDAGALMYNILSLEPVPIGELCPDVSAELQSVVARLLIKDPDLRYQGFDDILFDTQPALQGLKTARARELAEEARTAKTQNQFEAAQGLIRQALELAPELAEARQLREELQAALRRQAIRPRVENLLKKGKEALAAGNHGEAVEQFESAIRLDPVSVESRSLLQEARAAVERARETARLVAEAENAARRGDATAAARLARQALALSPGDSAAQQVSERAEAALAEEQRKIRLADSLARVKRLLEIRSWNEAAALLSSLAVEFPGTQEVEAFAEELRAGQWKEEREQQLSSGLSEARKKIQQGDLAAALAGLEDLRGRFAESEEVESLLRFVQSEIAEKRRRDAVGKCLEQARAFAARHNLDAARKTLEAGLAEHPGDAALQHELRAVLAEQKETARRVALEHALSTAGQMRVQRKLDEALELLDKFVDAHGGDATVEQLRSSVFDEMEAARRAAELRDFIQRANKLMLEGRPEAAATMLHAAPESLKGDSEITRMLGAAELKRQERDERQAAIEETVSETARLGQEGRFDQALQVLDAFRGRYGEEPRIQEAGWELERQRQEFQSAAARLSERANALLNQDPGAATVLLRAAPAPLQDHPAIRAAADAAAKAEYDQRVRLEVAERIAQAQALSERTEFAEALRVLDEGLVRFPDHPEIRRVRTEIANGLEQYRREQQRHATLAQIRDLLELHRYGEAERIVAGVLAGDPGDELFQGLRGEIETRKQRWAAERADQEVRETLARARETLPRNPVEAAALLETLSRKFPDRSEVAAALAESRDAVAKQQRRESIQSAEGLCERGEFDAAVAKLSAVRPDPSGEIAAALERVQGLREKALSQRVAEAIRSARELRERDPQGALRLLDRLPQPLRGRPEVETEVETCRQAIARAERAAVLAGIDQLCSSGKLAKARARYQEAVTRFGADAELKGVLDRIEAAEQAKQPKRPPVQEEGTPRDRRPVWVAAGLAVTAVVGVGVWWSAHRTPVPLPSAESEAKPAVNQPRAVSSPGAVSAPSAKAKEAPAVQPPPQTQGAAKGPADSSSAKPGPTKPSPTKPGPVNPAPANTGPTNPEPAQAGQRDRQEAKAFVPPKQEPDRNPDRNKDKGAVTLEAPPQVAGTVPPTPVPAASTGQSPLPQPVIPPVTPPQQPKSQPPPTETPAVAQNLRVEQQIRATLNQLNASVSNHRPDDLKAIWPGVSADFREAVKAKSPPFEYELRPTGAVQINGNRATIECDSVSKVVVRSKATQSQKKVQVTLQNIGGDRWQIIDIR